MSDTTPVIHPKFHHVNLKTTRLQEMIDWYAALVGAEVTVPGRRRRLAVQRRGQPPHRAARVPDFVDDPEKDTRTGLHHTAFEYDELRGAQRELPAAARGGDRAGLLPRPRHDVLLLLPRPRRQPRRAAGRQLRRLGRSRASGCARSAEFHANPIGVFVDPAQVADAAAAGAVFEEIHERAMAGEFAPAAAAGRVPPEAERMRLVTYEDGAGTHAGVLVGEEIVPARSARRPPAASAACSPSSTPAGLAELGERAAQARTSASRCADVRLLAPVPDPEKIICMGLNYRDHAEEAGQEIPEHPRWFAQVRELAGRRRRRRSCCRRAHPEFVDYEAELAVVIGRAAHDVARGRRAVATSPARCRSTTSARATCSSRTRCGRAARRSTRSPRAARRS